MVERVKVRTNKWVMGVEERFVASDGTHHKTLHGAEQQEKFLFNQSEVGKITHFDFPYVLEKQEEVDSKLYWVKDFEEYTKLFEYYNSYWSSGTIKLDDLTMKDFPTWIHYYADSSGEWDVLVFLEKAEDKIEEFRKATTELLDGLNQVKVGE